MNRSLYLLIIFLPFVSAAQNVSDVVTESNKITDTARQTDLIDIARKVFHIGQQRTRSPEDKKIYFSLLPFSGPAPGGSGRAVITSTTAAIYLGPRRTTNISSATFTPYWNFSGRFGLPLYTNIWLPDNTWTISGDTRFLVYPQYTWGLGSQRSEDEKRLLDYKYIRFYQSALKKIKPYFFAGLGYQLDYHFNIGLVDSVANLKQYSGYGYGTGANSFSSGISVNALYDTRNNSLNPLPGMYANVVYRINSKWLGSNQNWNSLYVDLRKYISLNKVKNQLKQTFALWSYLWTIVGGNAPYLDLPAVGWDPANRSGRGFDQNRYRGKTLLYAEAEYRRTLTRDGLFGIVLFSNINTVSGSNSFFNSWHPSAGAGARIKFNKGSDTNIGIDYAMSRGYNSIILSLGEAF